MTISRRSAGALGVFALAMLGAATPALAQSDLVVQPNSEVGTVTRTMKVNVSDLALSTPQGRARLENRITLAAKRVCDYNGGIGLRQPADYYNCYDAAKSGAMSSANAVHTASNGFIVVASR
ncbi:MAG TPA: UrcA family protein [Sphingobium sp.]